MFVYIHTYMRKWAHIRGPPLHAGTFTRCLGRRGLVVEVCAQRVDARSHVGPAARSAARPLELADVVPPARPACVRACDNVSVRGCEGDHLSVNV